jgi:uncharacterized protein (TIGR02453 family)
MRNPLSSERKDVYFFFMDQHAFTGFPNECPAFFRGLALNNTAAWFNFHRAEYEEFVITPARLFIMEMGERLRTIAPDIVADPRVNRSLFRINRDIRFSRDKTPYKTHLAILFWEGAGSRLECPGFYFHIDSLSLYLGAGIYMFPDSMLPLYRDAVVHRTRGAALVRAVREVSSKGAYTIGGGHYKRIPSGYDPAHPNAPFLLHNGLWAGYERPLPGELFSRDILDYCCERFADMAPIHRWLADLLETG